jgi:benzoyl-CoA reductase subunit C
MPMLTGPEARKRFGTKPKDFLIAELKDFKASLENWSGSRISEEALDRSIEVYNTNRRLLRQLWQLRRNDPPPFSGTEAMQIVLSMMLMDKEAGNSLLRNLIEQLPRRQDGPKPGTRLMLAGGENWDIRIPALVESIGANVVIEDLCMGSRYFWNETIPEKERLAAIAQRYLDRPPCPTTDVLERRRVAHISSLIEEYNVQGVWLIQQKFCDPHEFDNVALASFFDGRGIPNYTSELDTTVAEGPLKIRLQAFLEVLGGDELFY